MIIKKEHRMQHKIKNQELLNKIERDFMKNDIPTVKVGDNVKLGLKIKEGEKTRIQEYSGVVIAKQNAGVNKTIVVRKIMQGIGIERCFLIHSPKIETIEIIRSSKVRRARLYYLRNLFGKATRLKQVFG
jgi:large subunit ribosomal protein L19